MLILLTVTKGHRSVYVNIDQLATIQPRLGASQFDPGAVITFANGNWIEVEENVASILKKLAEVQGESVINLRLDALETQGADLETRVTVLESQN